jgi:hypothetical protein
MTWGLIKGLGCVKRCRVSLALSRPAFAPPTSPIAHPWRLTLHTHGQFHPSRSKAKTMSRRLRGLRG